MSKPKKRELTPAEIRELYKKDEKSRVQGDKVVTHR